MPDELKDFIVLRIKHLLKLLPVILFDFGGLEDEFIKVILQVLVFVILLRNTSLVFPLNLFFLDSQFLQYLLSFLFALIGRIG